MIFIDDIPGQPISPEAAEQIREWYREQLAAGHVGIGSLRIPDSEDILKSLDARTDTES